MEIINKYFPQLSAQQHYRFSRLGEIYKFWNNQINLISRKDIDHLYEHHILHSLAIAKFIRFASQTTILDVGTGGGFPGIPLAILFEDCNFTLIDSTGKKIKAVNAIIEQLGLSNANAQQVRSNEYKQQFDFVISRAVSSFPEFVGLTRHNVGKGGNNALPNGIIYLKGGNLETEIEPFKHDSELISISDFFNEPYFETKKIVYLPVY